MGHKVAGHSTLPSGLSRHHALRRARHLGTYLLRDYVDTYQCDTGTPSARRNSTGAKSTRRMAGRHWQDG